MFFIFKNLNCISIMKNKFLAVTAAVLLAAGVAFSFAAPSNSLCNQAAGTCCDMPCPSDGCPVPCCDADGNVCTK